MWIIYLNRLDYHSNKLKKAYGEFFHLDMSAEISQSLWLLNNIFKKYCKISQNVLNESMSSLEEQEEEYCKSYYPDRKFIS